MGTEKTLELVAGLILTVVSSVALMLLKALLSKVDSNNSILIRVETNQSRVMVRLDKVETQVQEHAVKIQKLEDRL